MILFSLLQKAKEILTESNIPHGNCVICLYDFKVRSLPISPVVFCPVSRTRRNMSQVIFFFLTHFSLSGVFRLQRCCCCCCCFVFWPWKWDNIFVLIKKEIIIMRIIVRCSLFFLFLVFCKLMQAARGCMHDTAIKSIHFKGDDASMMCFTACSAAPQWPKIAFHAGLDCRYFRKCLHLLKMEATPFMLWCFLLVFRRERRSPRRAATTTSTANASAATSATLRASSVRGRRS